MVDPDLSSLPSPATERDVALFERYINALRCNTTRTDAACRQIIADAIVPEVVRLAPMVIELARVSLRDMVR